MGTDIGSPKVQGTASTVGRLASFVEGDIEAVVEGSPKSSPKMERRHSGAFLTNEVLGGSGDTGKHDLKGGDEKSCATTYIPVALLGPGAMFGEVALLNDSARNATVQCKSACEFLVIERDDYDRFLKAEMRRLKENHKSFMLEHIPGMRLFTDAVHNDCLHYIRNGSFPKNHRFLKQGEFADGAFHIVFNGSVEVLSASPLHSTSGSKRKHRNKERRVGILPRGGVFASAGPDVCEPFSFVAASAPCEVFTIGRGELKRLPEMIAKGLREVADQATLRLELRQTQPAEGGLGGLGITPNAMNSMVSKSSPCLGRTLPQRPRTTARVLGLPCFADFEEFHLEPGECLGLLGQKPKLRSKPLPLNAPAARPKKSTA